MDILDDVGVSKLSAKFFFKVNYSFNFSTEISLHLDFSCFSLFLNLVLLNLKPFQAPA